MADIEPITREEVLLNSIAEGTGLEIQPITRKEMYLSADEIVKNQTRCQI